MITYVQVIPPPRAQTCNFVYLFLHLCSQYWTKTVKFLVTIHLFIRTWQQIRRKFHLHPTYVQTSNCYLLYRTDTPHITAVWNKNMLQWYLPVVHTGSYIMNCSEPTTYIYNLYLVVHGFYRDDILHKELALHLHYQENSWS